jgi:hypothetical protein
MVNNSLLDYDRLQIGGLLYLRYQTSFAQGGFPDDEDRLTTMSSPNLLNLYMDANPTDRIRGYISGRLTYEPMGGMPAAYGMTPDELGVLLDQLWLKFDLGRRVFITLGKQQVRFGATMLWNPADIINTTRRNPVALFDERTGIPMVRAQIPYGDNGGSIILMALLDGADAASEVGLVGRLESVLGPVAAGLGGTFRKDIDHKIGLDLSTALGPLDLTGELGLGLPWEPKEDESYTDQVALQASIGLSWQIRYSDEDFLIIGG